MVEVEALALLERRVGQVAVVGVLIEQRDGMAGEALHQATRDGRLSAGGRIAAEALDIAKSAGQSPTTAHLLLATFTVPSAADVLLRERGCDEDRVLEELARARPSEAPDGFAQALDRARQIADDCGSSAADALHLLVALTRLPRSAAVTLLDRLINLASLRTTALGYLTGAVPRRRVPQEVRVTAPVERKTYARPAPVVPRMAIPAAAPAPSPATSERSGVDAAPSVVATPPPAAAPAHDDAAGDAPQVSLSIGPIDVQPARAKENIAPSSPPAPDAAQPWALDPREFPYLVMHGRNLSALAARRQLDPALGREAEVEEVLDILGKRRANNPILVGEPGVGKTAIVEGLAERLVELRAGRIVVELDVAGLLAGTQLRGSVSERLLGVKDEVRGADGRIVVFIDELHMLIGAGATGEGPQDAANELKAALAREPSPRGTIAILRGAAGRYEAHHGVRFRADALEAAALLTARYVRDRC